MTTDELRQTIYKCRVKSKQEYVMELQRMVYKSLEDDNVEIKNQDDFDGYVNAFLSTLQKALMDKDKSIIMVLAIAVNPTEPAESIKGIMVTGSFDVLRQNLQMSDNTFDTISKIRYHMLEERIMEGPYDLPYVYMGQNISTGEFLAGHDVIKISP